MNKMYEEKNTKTVGNKENTAIRQARLLAEKENAAKKKSASILNYYINGQPS